MTVVNYNRKIKDLKTWRVMPTLLPASTAAGMAITSSPGSKQLQMFFASSTVHYIYDPFEDGYIQTASGALAGTFGAGACSVGTLSGPSGTATAGAASTLTTNLTLARSLKGFKIQITGGPGAGDIRTIAYNDVGANAKITVTLPFTTPPTTSSTYRLITPRWYIMNAGTVAAGSFKSYDYALNVWTTLVVTNLPAAWATDGRLVATTSMGSDDAAVSFATGTATSATGTTLVNSGKTWVTNQWSNYQVRIVSGTGAGQIRSITSNTATTLTVPTWTTTPDVTSVYSIEGNDDYLYLLGNAAVAMYRYSISANTWTLLTPSVARAGAPGTVCSGTWVSNVKLDARWSDENDIINGRRIYSFRGGGTASLDYYDIALNAWSTVSWAPGAEVFSTGSKYIYIEDYLYIHKDATGRWFRYNFPQQEMVGWSTNPYPGGAAVIGDTAFDVFEPETGIRYAMMALNTSTVVMRCMIV